MEESTTALHDVISRENLEEDLQELEITAMPGAPQHSTSLEAFSKGDYGVTRALKSGGRKSERAREWAWERLVDLKFPDKKKSWWLSRLPEYKIFIIKKKLNKKKTG